MPPPVGHDTSVRLSLENIGLPGVDLNVTILIDPNLQEKLKAVEI
jgi:hypothetical protein